MPQTSPSSGGLLADAVPPAHVRRRRARLLLAQNRDDLLFAESTLPHGPSSFAGLLWQPRDRIGGRPPGFTIDDLADRSPRVRRPRPGHTSDVGEDRIEARSMVLDLSQVMIRHQRVGSIVSELVKCGELVLKDSEDELCVGLRVVRMTCLKPSVVIVLDQMIVEVPRKRERVQPQRVDRGLFEEAKVASGGLQVPHVELDNVVAEDEVGGVRVRVETCQGLCQITSRMYECLAGVGPHGRKALQSICLGIDF